MDETSVEHGPLDPYDTASQLIADGIYRCLWIESQRTDVGLLSHASPTNLERVSLIQI